LSLYKQDRYEESLNIEPLIIKNYDGSLNVNTDHELYNRLSLDYLKSSYMSIYDQFEKEITGSDNDNALIHNFYDNLINPLHQELNNLSNTLGNEMNNEVKVLIYF